MKHNTTDFLLEDYKKIPSNIKKAINEEYPIYKKFQDILNSVYIILNIRIKEEV